MSEGVLELKSEGSPGRPITTIAQLNPSIRNWMIAAKVSSKSPISSSRTGTVEYVHVIFLDNSGAIKAVLFDDECYQFYNSLKVGQLYYISQGRLQETDPFYQPIHPYEIAFTGNTLVKPAVGLEVPELSKNFAPLATVSELSLGTTADIIGIVTDVSDLYTITPYDNDTEVRGRKITLTDESNGKVIVLLSGQRAINYCSKQLNPVVAFKNAKIIDTKEDVILVANSRSVMEIDPDIAAAEKLRKWFSCKDANNEDEGSPTKKMRSD